MSKLLDLLGRFENVKQEMEKIQEALGEELSGQPSVKEIIDIFKARKSESVIYIMKVYTAHLHAMIGHLRERHGRYAGIEGANLGMRQNSSQREHRANLRAQVAEYIAILRAMQGKEDRK